MQLTFVPAYTRTELQNAEAEILNRDHEAKFSGVPFIESRLNITGAMKEIVEKNNCDHVGGLIGQEQSCSMVLTPKGRIAFVTAVKNKSFFSTLQFRYTLKAVVKNADGSFSNQEITHGIAVRIDGSQLTKNDDL